MRFWILALALAACDQRREAGPSQEFDNEEEEQDTEETDTQDTDDIDTSCDTSALTFNVEVRDATGAPATTYARDDAPTLAASVGSTCAGPVRFDTSTTCLVTKWTLDGPDGPQDLMPTCTPVATSWTIEPAQKQEATWPLDPITKKGDYTVTVTFGYQDATATANFTVQ